MKSKYHLLSQFDRMSGMEHSGAGPGSSRKQNKEDGFKSPPTSNCSGIGEKLVLSKARCIQQYTTDFSDEAGEGRMLQLECSDGIHDPGSVQCLFGSCFPTIQTKAETTSQMVIKSDIGNKEKTYCRTDDSVVKGEFETQSQPTTTPQAKPTSTSTTPKNVLQVHAGQRRPQFTSTEFGGELDASENGSEKLSGSAYSAEITAFASELTGSTSTARTLQSNRRRRNTIGSDRSSISGDGSNTTVPNSPTDGGSNDQKGSTSRRSSFDSDIHERTPFHLANDVPPSNFGVFGSETSKDERLPHADADFYPSFTLLEDYPTSRRRNSFSLSANLPSSPNRPRSSASCPAVVDCDLPFVFTHDLHWTSREDSEELAGHIHNLNTLLLRDSLRASRELWDAKNRLHQKALKEKHQHQHEQQQQTDKDAMATTGFSAAYGTHYTAPQSPVSNYTSSPPPASKKLTPWQDKLSAMCSYSGIVPDYITFSDRRGGRTAWSARVTLKRLSPDGRPVEESYDARMWYDAKYTDNALEDAAEVAYLRMQQTQPVSPTYSALPVAPNYTYQSNYQPMGGASYSNYGGSYQPYANVNI